MRRLWTFAFAWIGLVAPASAQNWQDVIFPEPSHEFGNVARGSKIKHSFRLVNTTNATLHIADWKTKCGCTDVRVGAREIPPGTQTFVEATLDTTKFQGFKASGLTLVFDRPSYAEKDLNLSCFIRADVTLNPGVVDFGVANRSAAAPQVLTLSYAGGQPNWGVVKVQTLTEHVSARLEEIPGSRSGGSVQYRLTATLQPSAPLGYFKDQITLLTNDPQAPSIPISVSGNVQGNVVLTPAILPVGTVKAGQSYTKDVLIRSAQPFVITEVSGGGDALSADKGGDSPRPLHKITVTFKAPANPGTFHGSLDFKTSLPDEPPVKLSVFSTVVP